jgi:broad specificity phosphatase PhoE
VTELWMIRHGQTDWNKAGRYQGQADIPLNDTGFMQAREAADRLVQVEIPISEVYSSSLMRARQTAEVIASRLAVPLRIDPALCEISQGEWEGRHYSEVIGHYQQMAAEPEMDPVQWRAPGGESVAEVSQRVYAAAKKISHHHADERVLLVMHALAMAALLCMLRGISLREVYDHLPGHAVIEIVQLE